jgi:hypothetical protein|tara:strand:+ start:315 stop:434 length:120 start_codon:yes stop_codon:yes gene_type:complete
MIDTIKHLTGTCGEPHLNLATASIIFLVFVYTVKKLSRI